MRAWVLLRKAAAHPFSLAAARAHRLLIRALPRFFQKSKA